MIFICLATFFAIYVLNNKFHDKCYGVLVLNMFVASGMLDNLLDAANLSISKPDLSDGGCS